MPKKLSEAGDATIEAVRFDTARLTDMLTDPFCAPREYIVTVPL